MKNINKLMICFLLILISNISFISAQDTESDFYKIARIPMPEGVILETGGMVTLPNGDIAVATRRGEVYLIENPTDTKPSFKKIASGMHEILGLAYYKDHLYCAQRGELTKLIDKNGDGRIEKYETITTWPLSGHYHEYTFGPKVGADGYFYVTANLGFGSSDWWAGKAFVPYRGWTLRINPETGEKEAYAAGFRSPCGIGVVKGEFFYGDNQGDWMGSGFITHVQRGDFVGHPASLDFVGKLPSEVKMTKELIYAKVNPRDDPKKKPEYIQNEPFTTIYEMAKNNPDKQIKTPAVWLPHGMLGVSTSEIIEDQTNGNFGPFAGQVFVGDQGMSKIARVALEKIDGVYQGASFDFRSGFRSGVLRMTWGADNALYVGGTNRGWGSTGKEVFGLERMIYTGKIPFEIKTVKAKPDGFILEFTQAIDKKTAENVNNYEVISYNYKYHPVYGSPRIEQKDNAVRGAKLMPDGNSVQIVVDNLREGFIHEINTEKLISFEKKNPLHPVAYYTLNKIPTGAKADITLVTPKAKSKKTSIDPGMAVNTPDNQKKEAAPTAEGEKNKTTTNAPIVAKIITDKEAMAILQKNTCLACHKKNENAVGPSYKEIAARKYKNEKIVKLIYQPEPQNWPEYTPMAPMTNMPKAEAAKIAAWINSLK